MTSGTGSRATPTRIQTRVAPARNRAASTPTLCSITRNNTVPHAVMVAAERVPEAEVTGVLEEETGRPRPPTAATAITPASPRGSAEARIHRRD